MGDYIQGKWHKAHTRCEKCGRMVNQIMRVDNGPTTGKFCGSFCYNAARKEMENENISTD